MKIQIKTQEAGIHCVDLEGDLDFHTSPELRRQLTKIVDTEVRKIIVDLGKVPYIDSSGLATFIELFQKMRQGRRQLVLFSLMPAVRSVFEIAKLDSVFQLARNELEAMSFVS